jgi:hypothetical protein
MWRGKLDGIERERIGKSIIRAVSRKEGRQKWRERGSGRLAWRERSGVDFRDVLDADI